MASKKKLLENEAPIVEKEPVTIEEKNIIPEDEVKDLKPEKVIEVKAPKVEIKNKKKEENNKFNIGDIVFISKDAEADLNGFKLFPQYKKYTYTVEAYEPKSDVYTLRRLNLSLKLKGELILAPNERANDSLNRKQF